MQKKRITIVLNNKFNYTWNNYLSWKKNNKTYYTLIAVEHHVWFIIKFTTFMINFNGSTYQNHSAAFLIHFFSSYLFVCFFLFKIKKKKSF